MKSFAVVLVLLLVAGFVVDFGNVMSPLPDRGYHIPSLPVADEGGSGSAQHASGIDEEKIFISRVLADTEDAWHLLFKQMGKTYEEPKLVLYTGETYSGCETVKKSMGPLYCPRDQKIYLDPSFFVRLKKWFNAPGDFAQAYVIAHEVGHHVQNLLGVLSRVTRLEKDNPANAKSYSVRLELQADCLAGVWIAVTDNMYQRLEPGDIEEGLNAASQLGNDTIQKRTKGYVVADSFTHGSAEQRVRWFKTGYQAGTVQACDTFGAEEL